MDDKTLEHLLKQDALPLSQDRLTRIEHSILSKISVSHSRLSDSGFWSKPTPQEGLLAGLLASGCAAGLISVSGLWQSIFYSTNTTTWSLAVYHVWG